MTINMMHRTAATITDALEGLTTDDQILVSMILEEAGAVAAYHLASGKYYGFTNNTGQVVAYLPTSLTHLTVTPRAKVIPTYLPGKATPASIEDGGWDVYLDPWQLTFDRLATVRKETVHTQPMGRAALCSECYIEMPIKTGTCPWC